MTDPTLRLPPRFGGVKDGKLVWQALANVDHGLLGYFLTCHLLIEHYLDEYLKAAYPTLNWAGIRLNFSQRVDLLDNSEIVNDPKYDPLPAIKHVNALRNKISHRLDFRIDAAALGPLKDYLVRLDGSHSHEIPSDPRGLLELFTGTCSATFASHISFLHIRNPNS